MERAISFTAGKHTLLGIAHLPDQPKNVAVLIVVGGPQYRVGSHRQFIQLSRALANSNIASLRFDYTGMGDSEGVKKAFDVVCDDIGCAVDALCQETGCTNVAIWGLCDAASAAMIYASKDDRVKALVLLNPWLRSENTTAKTMFTHYYLQRLLSKDFWLKLVKGKVNVKAAVSDTKGFAESLTASNRSAATQDAYQIRMLRGAQQFDGPMCLILSGNDLTAREFELNAKSDKQWRKVMRNKTKVFRIEHADHTFSSATFKRRVEAVTIEFIEQCFTSAKTKQ